MTAIFNSSPWIFLSKLGLLKQALSMRKCLGKREAEATVIALKTSFYTILYALAYR